MDTPADSRIEERDVNKAGSVYGCLRWWRMREELDGKGRGHLFEPRKVDPLKADSSYLGRAPELDGKMDTRSENIRKREETRQGHTRTRFQGAQG